MRALGDLLMLTYSLPALTAAIAVFPAFLLYMARIALGVTVRSRIAASVVGVACVIWAVPFSIVVTLWLAESRVLRLLPLVGVGPFQVPWGTIVSVTAATSIVAGLTALATEEPHRHVAVQSCIAALLIALVGLAIVRFAMIALGVYRS